MSNGSIDSLAGIDEVVPEQPTIETEQVQETPQATKTLLDFAKTETGEGSVEEYLQHPLNFNDTKAVAKIIRGVTGLFGTLNFAVLDIIFGVLELQTKKEVQ